MWHGPKHLLVEECILDDGRRLTARVRDAKRPAKLTVGFQFTPTSAQLSPGPYWVIAAGRDAGSRPGAYDWAIISGGEEEAC
jgi:hypothetical protein